jgi:hypothetical protein
MASSVCIADLDRHRGRRRQSEKKFSVLGNVHSVQ